MNFFRPERRHKVLIRTELSLLVQSTESTNYERWLYYKWKHIFDRDTCRI